MKSSDSRSEREALYSIRVPSPTREYVLEVKEAAGGARYMVITERSVKGGKEWLSRIMVYEERLAEFVAGIQAASRFMEPGRRQTPGSHDTPQRTCR